MRNIFLNAEVEEDVTHYRQGGDFVAAWNNDARIDLSTVFQDVQSVYR
jgi:hypothetical protein